MRSDSTERPPGTPRRCAGVIRSAPLKWMGTAMNTSLFTADRGTHVKIVVIALVAAFVVATVAVNARISDPTATLVRRGGATLVVKAGEPVRYSIRDGAAIR